MIIPFFGLISWGKTGIKHSFLLHPPLGFVEFTPIFATKNSDLGVIANFSITWGWTPTDGIRKTHPNWNYNYRFPTIQPSDSRYDKRLLGPSMTMRFASGTPKNQFFGGMEMVISNHFPCKNLGTIIPSKQRFLKYCRCFGYQYYTFVPPKNIPSFPAAVISISTIFHHFGIARCWVIDGVASPVHGRAIRQVAHVIHEQSTWQRWASPLTCGSWIMDRSIQSNSFRYQILVDVCICGSSQKKKVIAQSHVILISFIS